MPARMARIGPGLGYFGIDMRIKAFLIAAALAASAALSGCMGDTPISANYSSFHDAAYTVPAIPITKVPREFRRRNVEFATDEKPGTIIVDTQAKYLYFVLPDGRAIRYWIGVGREGFEWHGTAHIAL